LRSQLITLLEKKAYITEGQKDLAMSKAYDHDRSRLAEVGHDTRGFLKISDFGTTIQSSAKDLNVVPSRPDTETWETLHLDLRPYMNPAPFSIQENTPLARVFRLYRAMGIRHLPVVDQDNVVVGILTRKELRTDFSTDLY